MLAIGDQVVAFFFDRAVYYFGSSVETDIEAAEKGRKTDSAKQLARTMRMNMWLETSQFRSI